MVASIGVFGALRFVSYSQKKTPLKRANILGNLLVGRIGFYSTIGLIKCALDVKETPEQVLGLGIIPVTIL